MAVAEGSAWCAPARLLCAAAILHLLLTVSVYAFGRYALFPGTFDKNGVAVAFARDCVLYRADAAALSEALWSGEIRRWVSADQPFHVKLYSICFAIFGPLFGYNILAAEPLNALFYLATLALVFTLGREIFNRRAGLWAAGVIAIWPSYLLHTTQLLKDPPFVAGMLALILIIVRWLRRDYTWRSALLWGLAGALLSTALWLTRADMGELLIPTVLLGALLLVARQLRERRVRATNLAGMALVVAATLSVPQLIPKALRLGMSPSSIEWTARQEALRKATAGEAATPEDESQTYIWTRLAKRVGKMRQRFVEMYENPGSNIDSDVQINSTADLVRYLPRAALIGFFAPFPNMWFTSGNSVGSAGRLLGGLESLAMYAVEGLAFLGLWLGRRRLSVWLLFSVAATGMIALGLVVVNVGALYRLRYVFLILLIILAAEGAAHILDRLSKKPREIEERGSEG